jgi:predicted ATPase
MAREHRLPGPGPYLRGIRRTGALAGTGRVRALPHVDWLPLREIELSQPVTFLVGENGAGKSTLLEAIAAGAGFAPEGGPLSDDLVLQTGHLRKAPEPETDREALGLELSAASPRAGFFLRAESFFDVALMLDASESATYGERDLHAQSHGESFVALAANRFGPEGLYLLDEPEAALSVTSALAFIDVVHASAAAGSQFVIATHSPVLLAVPGARILEVTHEGTTEIAYDEADPVRLHRAFLEAPERFLRHLT